MEWKFYAWSIVVDHDGGNGTGIERRLRCRLLVEGRDISFCRLLVERRIKVPQFLNVFESYTESEEFVTKLFRPHHMPARWAFGRWF